MIKFHCDVCGDVIDQHILNEARTIERQYVDTGQFVDDAYKTTMAPNESITQYQFCSKHMKELMSHLRNITQWQMEMYKDKPKQ